MVSAGRVVFGADETTQPRLFRYLFESDGLVMGSVHYSYAQTGGGRLRAADGREGVHNPKNWKDLRRVIQYLTGPEDIVVDFFAGSGSTAHAVIDLNATSPQAQVRPGSTGEVPDLKSEAAKAGYGTIAEIARDRLRRVGSAIRDGHEGRATGADVGFRSFAVYTTNLSDVLRPPTAPTSSLLPVSRTA